MNQRKIVLHIVISLETGGLERFVIELVNATNAHFVHKIVCLELAATCGIVDVICLDMNNGPRFRAVLEICKIIRINKIDLIHTHNEKAQYCGALSGAICRTPVVHTKHGKNVTAIRSLIRNYLLSYLCAKIVAVSEDAALQCINKEKIRPSKVMTILNGVDTDLYSIGRETSSLKASLGISNDIPVIGIIARLAPVKGHATLIATCRILKESGIDFRLLIVGDGPLKTELMTLANSLQLSADVIFAGARFDIPDLLNIMDIFVLSSISEGISLTLIEAMASGLPIIATDVGGNPEVVVSGETGFLVPPKEPVLMAERIQQLLNNEPLRKDLGRKGRLRACEYFSIKRVGQQYEELYCSVLNGISI
jgi:glycosyltransferase involved in cell wall biosynthesis